MSETNHQEAVEASGDDNEPGSPGSEPYSVTEEQRRGARRTAYFFFGLVLVLSILTALTRMFGW